MPVIRRAPSGSPEGRLSDQSALPVVHGSPLALGTVAAIPNLALADSFVIGCLAGLFRASPGIRQCSLVHTEPIGGKVVDPVKGSGGASEVVASVAPERSQAVGTTTTKVWPLARGMTG